jgi:5-methylcytosine-specific restriction endonuclease McrBC regulatory subunit McrC
MKISKPQLKALVESIVKEQMDSSSELMNAWETLTKQQKSSSISIGFVIASLVSDQKTQNLIHSLTEELEPHEVLMKLVNAYGAEEVMKAIKKGLRSW